MKRRTGPEQRPPPKIFTHRRKKGAFLLCLLCGVCMSVWPSTRLLAAEIETPFIRFTLSPADGHCEVLDKRANVTWGQESHQRGFGEIVVAAEGKPRHEALGACVIQSEPGELLASFHPLSAEPAAELRVRVRALADQKTLEVSYNADEALHLQSIKLLGGLLQVTGAGKGYVVVPVREGLLIPADSGLSFTHRFDTYAYEGCLMEMLGLVQDGAAALVSWHDPYVAAEVKSVVTPSGQERQKISSAFTLRKSAASLRLEFLGKADYVEIAKAYRAIAKERGLLVTWDQKLKTDPERAKLFGAIDFKLWSALSRRMNAESTKEESVRVNWTFDEAAQVAEHIKRDLKLDHVLFTIGGWIHRGYDNQHPDILPTAPECGGDAAFSDCARRVMALGYLFCLHDNYQDMYRDSPSWNPRYIMKTPDGKLVRGGHWAGGMAYLICSKMALQLAERPQNLPGVKKLSNANAYFIDTTYAAGLQECYDPAHPLTRSDDMKWKQALSDYARSVFGVFGSEDGREWAIPHSDFFEGITGVSGRSFHDASLAKELGGTVVPLFELVYHDCIAAYGKYGYDPNHAAAYVLQHIMLGRPLNYHSIPPHLYWKHIGHKSRHSWLLGSAAPAQTASSQPLKPDPALFTRADNGWAEGLCPMDRFVKNTYEILSPLNELTARMQMTSHQFLTPDRKVQESVFGKGADAVTTLVNEGDSSYACISKLGGKVLLPPNGFLIEGPRFVAFAALRWNAVRYNSPVLFTLRSLDGKPLSDSHAVRVFHGFGDAHIRLGSFDGRVRREAKLDPSQQGS